MRTDKRPSWMRTHHTKPARPNGRRERRRLRHGREVAIATDCREGAFDYINEAVGLAQ